jgi:GntR family transcriptional regulator
MVVSVAAVDIDRTSETPTYQQVAAILRERITSGELGPADQLPSVHSLVMETGLADATIRAAIRVLRNEGLVRTAPGCGVFVVARG